MLKKKKKKSFYTELRVSRFAIQKVLLVSHYLKFLLIDFLSWLCCGFSVSGTPLKKADSARVEAATLESIFRASLRAISSLSQVCLIHFVLAILCRNMSLLKQSSLKKQLVIWSLLTSICFVLKTLLKVTYINHVDKHTRISSMYVGVPVCACVVCVFLNLFIQNKFYLIIMSQFY